MKQFYLTATLLFSGLVSAFAQTSPTPPQSLAEQPRVYTHRNSFWNEENFSGNITEDKKWQYQVDYQYRRSADASYIKGENDSKGDYSNIFKEPVQQVLRPWVHYWIKPGVVRFSLSPIGYWITWTPSAEGQVYKTAQGDVGRTVYPEFRICPQITIVNNLGRLTLMNRYRYEFRWIGNREKSTGFFDDLTEGYSFYPNSIGSGTGSAHLGRFRWQVKAQLLLNKEKMEKNAVYLNTWNEVFLGIGRHVDWSKMLNQNRTVALLGWKLPTEIPVKVEAGVTEQVAFMYNLKTAPTQPNVLYNKQNVEVNTAYSLYLIFDDMGAIFRKKKPVVPAE